MTHQGDKTGDVSFYTGSDQETPDEGTWRRRSGTDAGKGSARKEAGKTISGIIITNIVFLVDFSHWLDIIKSEVAILPM